MKTRIWFYLLLSVCAAWLAAGAEGSPTPELTSIVREKKLPEFLEAAKNKALKVPKIHSAWKVQGTRDQIAKEEGQAALALGREVARKLSELAPVLVSMKDPKQLEQQVTMLLDLADWLAEQETYGNLFLAARAHDLATVGIARLIADLNFPLQKIDAMFSRFKARWYSAGVRAAALNEEVGTALFPIDASSGANTQDSLEELWRLGAALARERKYPELRVLRQNNPADAPALRENISFFDGAEGASPNTEENLTKKSYYKFVIGLEPHNVARLRDLLTFRREVKAFPVKPSNPNHPYASDGEAAFAEAWRPYQNKAKEALYSPAWLVYEKIIEGKFVDDQSEFTDQ